MSSGIEYRPNAQSCSCTTDKKCRIHTEPNVQNNELNINEVIERFVELVYPGNAELASQMFNEKKCLTDASDLITQQQARLASLEEANKIHTQNAVQAGYAHIDNQARIAKLREALLDAVKALRNKLDDSPSCPVYRGEDPDECTCHSDSEIAGLIHRLEAALKEDFTDGI